MSDMTMTKEAIISYYDSCESDYRLFWGLNGSHALHAGYWDETTSTLADALERENQILAEMAKITSQDRVLDAGCGIGGSSLYLARHYGCEVVGITLSARQAATASDLALQTQSPRPPTFCVMDFTQTTFPENSFDVVWGLESICHVEDKSLFLREAFRILKPGGRLIVADGFLTKERLNLEEQKKMNSWLNGWGVSSLESVRTFREGLITSGFQAVSYRDITPFVLPSSKRLYWVSFPALLMSKVGEWLRLRTKIQTANILAAYHQYGALRNNIWQYGIFSASKT